MASIAAKKNPLTSKKSSTVNSRVHASDSISIGETPLVAEKDVVGKAKRRTSDFGADFAYAREEDDMCENIGIGKHAVETVSSVAKSDSSARFVAGTGINALNSKHKAPQSMAKSSQSSSNTKSEVAKENPVDEKSLQPEANSVAIGRKSITQRRQSVGFQIMDVFEDKLGIVAIDQTDEIDESMSIQDQFLEMQTRLEMRCEEMLAKMAYMAESLEQERRQERAAFEEELGRLQRENEEKDAELAKLKASEVVLQQSLETLCLKMADLAD